ncbi:MAG: hypothetical protein CMLOHMNK_00271 [Steroidobacteraceae bacterium]|nr:hypothetical protein [Steroidobacteraceae bacterium]
MTLWRLYRKAHGPGLDGLGGHHAGGRWHSVGRAVVYFGAGPAIVVLERLAHLDPAQLPTDLVLGRFEIDTIVRDAWETGSIPAHWTGRRDLTRALGDAWLKARRSCLLRVPSAVVPEEQNLIFNPQHQDAHRMRLVRARPFEFDVRLI